MPQRLESTLGGLRRLASFVGDHHYLGRYSLEKLHLFEQYQRNTSALRVAAVLVLTPLPTFFALVVMNLVPLNDPRAGASHNAAFFVRATLSQALRTFFTLLPLKQALALPKCDYSFKTIACIACCTALAVEGLRMGLAFSWRFPVPFTNLIGLPVFLASVCVFNFAFAKSTMQRLWRKRKLQLYVPIVGVQLVLFYSFLGLSVAFAHLSLRPQIFLVMVLPLAKFLLKHLVWKYARRLHDISTDITICMLEISGALYQTVCTQFVNSNWLNVWMVAADLMQCIHEVRSYVKLDYMGDGRSTLVTARAIIDSALESAGNRSRRASFSTTPTIRATASDASRHGLNVDDGSNAEVELAVSTQVARLYRGVSAPSALQPLADRELQYTVRSVYIPQSKIRFVSLVRGKSSRRLLDFNRVTARGSVGRASNVDEYSSQQSEGRPRLAANEAGHTGTNGDAGVKIPAPLLKTIRKGSAGFLRCRHSSRRHKTAKVYAVAVPEPPITLEVDADSANGTSLGLLSTPFKPLPPDEETGRPGHAVSSSVSSSTSRVLLHHHSKNGVRIDGVRIAHRHQARLLEQTLQLLFASEVLLFAEYMEVVIPVLYALCLSNEWLSPNAKYNIVVMNLTSGRVLSEIANALAYALLEMVSLLAMYWFMKRRYGISALYQLAFVLETYWMTLQGKLVGAFIVVFNAVTVHQGATLMFSE